MSNHMLPGFLFFWMRFFSPKYPPLFLFQIYTIFQNGEEDHFLNYRLARVLKNSQDDKHLHHNVAAS